MIDSDAERGKIKVSKEKQGVFILPTYSRYSAQNARFSFDKKSAKQDGGCMFYKGGE